MLTISGIFFFSLLVGSSLAQGICQDLCDGDSSANARNPRSPYSTSVFGREIRIQVSDESNVAFGSISNGQPGDEVWLDRTWDGGLTWASGSRIGNARIPAGRTDTSTPVYNIDGDITRQQIGALRACGKTGDRDDTVCTPWARSTVRASTPVQAAATAMMQLYNDHGMWQTVGWWNGANCLSALMDYMRITGDMTYSFIIDTTYEKNKNDWSGDFMSNSVDDTAWWGLVWAEAYQITGNTKYLDNAVRINDFLQTFTTDKCGGGIVWSAASQYKNAITNELFLKLSAVLHNTIPGDTKYLGWAVDYFNWFVNCGMINNDNLINDGLTTSCENNRDTTWTYNQGVILGAASELFKATNNQQYLDIGRRIASAVVSSPALSPNGILREPCDNGGDCGPDAPTFKGVFARNLGELNAVLADRPFTDYIRRNAEKIVESGSSLNQYGLHYEGPFQFFSAATHQSAFEMLVANERFKN